MKFFKDNKQYRYKGFDYSQFGFYFVTICAKDGVSIFGNVDNCKMIRSEVGEIVERFWLEIPKHFSFVNLDEYIVMPNHVHGIIQIIDDVSCVVGSSRGTGQCPVRTEDIGSKGSKFGKVTPRSLSTIIGSYKAIVTKTVRFQVPSTENVWHPRFHDRIIRNDEELNKARQYIIDNPDKWEMEKNNSESLFM